MTYPFSIGREVVITGKPVSLDTDEYLGLKFTIDTIGKRCDEICFSDGHLPWYPASSLRLVEPELKIGDYAEVINPGVSNVGEIHKVIRIDASPYDGYPIQLDDFSWWGVASLRKLTPEEVSMYTSTLGYKMQEYNDEMETAMETLRELLAPLVDERLSDIEKRLAILEGERPEVCDRQPGTESIRVSIQRGNDPARIFVDNCSFGCLIWAKKVLNGMREE